MEIKYKVYPDGGARGKIRESWKLKGLITVESKNVIRTFRFRDKLVKTDEYSAAKRVISLRSRWRSKRENIGLDIKCLTQTQLQMNYHVAL